MSADDEETGAAARGRGDSRAAPRHARREELRRRVDEGYYLTPRMAWEVAKRIAAHGEL